jgi:mRNA-degrading endonuclease HigB of HigAB toxin-antitoxin module
MRILLAVAILALASPSSALGFDVAVEAPAGYAITVFVQSGDTEATAAEVYRHHETIINRYENRWYVVNVQGHRLKDIGQVCALAALYGEEVMTVCSAWRSFDFVEGNPQAVLLKLELPELPPPEPFDIAVEAPAGLEMVFILGGDGERIWFNNQDNPIRNRWLNRYYVVNIEGRALGDVSIICVTHRLVEPKFICARRGEYKFLSEEGNRIVHIVYPDPR